MAEKFEVRLPGHVLEDEPDNVRDERPEGVQGLVQRMAREAKQWHETEIEPSQTLLTEYYNEEPFGNEVEGRSQVVSPDVRSVTQAILPSLMRVFFGPEKAVEYRPDRADAEAAAEQATDYVNYIVREENRGFQHVHAAFKDALVRYYGVIKYWWEDMSTVEEETYEGLLPEQVNVLASDPEVTVLDVFEDEDGIVSIEIEYERSRGRVRIEAIPPEEITWSPNARDFHTAQGVFHSRPVYLDEIVAMGFDRDEVEAAAGVEGAIDANRGDNLEDARRHDDGGTVSDEDEADPLTRPILFTEAYVRMVDEEHEDSVARLRKFSCVGSNYTIVGDEDGEIVPERPFAWFVPDPEPHTPVGLCPAAYVKSVQLAKSALMRGMLDSMSQSLIPMKEIVEGMVSVADLKNMEVGKTVRVKKPGMMREITTPFVGREALDVLAYMDERKENDTGISKAAAGLDADALQSSTKAAVAATLTGAQQHIELTARMMAENGMRDLYAGILRLIRRHQDYNRTVRLRGRFEEVDPRTWDAEMDVSINVALGAGMPEERLAKLAMIAEKQEALLQMGSPLVTMVEYRATLARMAELAGYVNPDEFFRPWGIQEQQEAEWAAAQQPQQPDAATMLAQVEMAKVEQQREEASAKLALEHEKMRLQDDREREKIARDAALKQLEIETKAQVDADDRALRAQIAADRAAMDADIQHLKVAGEIEAARSAAPQEQPPQQ